MKARVLIADDASFMRQMIREIIEPEGYEVVGEATNGIEAVDQFLELRPDLVTMDIEMPEMDGVELTRKIRKDSRLCRLPVVAVTSLSSDVDVQRGIEAGVDDAACAAIAAGGGQVLASPCAGGSHRPLKVTRYTSPRGPDSLVRCADRRRFESSPASSSGG